VRIGYDVATPANAPIGQIAWNAFGYGAVRADNDEVLVPSEPRKVGLEVFGTGPPPEDPPGISLVKYVNGIHAPNPPGPTIAAGAPVVFTYLVTNTGLLTLNGVVLVDDELGTLTCPRTTLAPGENMTCTSASYPAISGRYDNVATVTGQPVDSSGTNAGPPLTDTDKGNYTNGELPDTGSSSDRLAQLGGLLLVLGVGFMVLGRRRQEAAARAGRARSR
jgi:LPXTG-motif cell wall-anchored protein